MNELPDPLTPADCNLRGLRWMPLDVVRVLDSDLFGISTGDEFKIAFRLWAKSWGQVPAASLPDDDRILAHLAGLSENVPKWKRVREVALRGWIKCSDGRLYHAVIAEKALEAMQHREDYTEKEENKESRQKRYRERRSAMFEQLRDHGIVPDMKTPMDELERLIDTVRVTHDVTHTVTDSVTSVTHALRNDDASATANDTDTTGQDSKPKNLGGDTHATGTPVRASDLSSAMRRHSIEAQPGDPRIIAAAEAGVTVATIEAACAQAKATKPNERIPPNYVVTIAMNWTADASAPRPVQARATPTNARDESRKRAYEVLTGKTAGPQSEPAEVINGHIKLIG